jgi:hypothetical protein
MSGRPGHGLPLWALPCGPGPGRLLGVQHALLQLARLPAGLLLLECERRRNPDAGLRAGRVPLHRTGDLQPVPEPMVLDPAPGASERWDLHEQLPHCGGLSGGLGLRLGRGRARDGARCLPAAHECRPRGGLLRRCGRAQQLLLQGLRACFRNERLLHGVLHEHGPGRRAGALPRRLDLCSGSARCDDDWLRVRASLIPVLRRRRAGTTGVTTPGRREPSTCRATFPGPRPPWGGPLTSRVHTFWTLTAAGASLATFSSAP